MSANALPANALPSGPLPIITEIKRIKDFGEMLKNNPGLIILKFGAEWCSPCKRIEPLVNEWFSRMPSTIQCCIIDVDDNFELYGFLKNKKMINGIPAILCYVKGNLDYVPDDITTGCDPAQTNAFFMRCIHL
jgi:thioredoxin 1